MLIDLCVRQLPAPVDLADLIKALETAKRPLPRDIPAFPVRKRDLAGNTIEQTKIGNREELPPHVPSFLPPLPNRHTYSSESRVVVERDQDTKRTRLDLLGQKSQIQQSLHGLQTVLASTVSTSLSSCRVAALSCLTRRLLAVSFCFARKTCRNRASTSVERLPRGDRRECIGKPICAAACGGSNVRFQFHAFCEGTVCAARPPQRKILSRCTHVLSMALRVECVFRSRAWVCSKLESSQDTKEKLHGEHLGHAPQTLKVRCHLDVCGWQFCRQSLTLHFVALLLLFVCSNQELGKEEKILSGTFHDGDSE